MPNALAHETSPYLLQHADNPVNWYPWGDEALRLSAETQKPILLSIGYAACHWCHVMAHESFEDPTTAEIMNRHFINVKVDREERPDLDAIYMSAVQALTGHGGWPMTVFLTPDGEPFYGGTYFPPAPRYGMPSFPQVLQSVADAWANRRDEILESASKIAGHLGQVVDLGVERGSVDDELFSIAVNKLSAEFDAEDGGFNKAPKFPPSMTIEFLLRMVQLRDDDAARHMADLTLSKMAYSGMYDQLGGGFARYATDNKWLIPHFEKMLYDNALLARVYLHAYQVTDNALYRRIAEETLDFVVREMRHESGGFYSSYDADSEGQEGKFYVWDSAEIVSELGEDAPLFMAYYDVTPEGNWEGVNILNIKYSPESVAAEFGLSVEEMRQRLAAARQTLYDVRAERVWPGLDDKVLTAWNGLMLAAFAEAGRILGRDDYTQVAIDNAQFLHATMRQANGRLLRTWKAGGAAKYNAYLEDYAYLADGVLALYQTTFDEQWYVWAAELAEQMVAHFGDAERGGFYDTSDDHEALLHRPKDVQDNATPSGNSMAAHVLLKLSLYTGNGDYWESAEQMIAALYGALSQFPTGFGHWLCAAAFMHANPQELAIVGEPDGDDTQALLSVANRVYRPALITAVASAESAIPLLHQRTARDGQATAYLCRGFVCQQPTTDAATLAQQLGD